MTDEALRQENARLRRKLAAAGVVELPNADLPNASELERLIRLVGDANPKLRCSADECEQFRNAINFCAYVYRTEPNGLYAVSYWTDFCREWLRTQGIYPNDMGLRPFVAGALASGISFEPYTEAQYINLGLSLGSAGTPSSAWRDILAKGLRPSVEPRRPMPRVIETQILSPGDRDRTSW